MIHPDGIKPEPGWRRDIFEVIFKADTSAGRTFDVALIASIVLSVIVVMLDSVAAIEQQYGGLLYSIEWVFTILFSIEYVLRVVCVRNKHRYIFSFYGIIDFLSIIPTYLSIIIPGSQYLLVIRSLRILRIFRVLKLVQYVDEANFLRKALKASARKIFVFLFTVMMLVIIMGSLLYIIEGAENGFTSIPRSIYWAIVTLTTVGFGDIAPQTPLGQALASFIMIIGYGIIAVPTGIVTYDMTQLMKDETSESENESKIETEGSENGNENKMETETECPSCGETGHDGDAQFCKYCGNALADQS